MALMLAPYNEAMRIGMGFNSYTQQLCVNDIVRKPDGKRASERDLRAVDHTKSLPASSGNEGGILTKPQGSFVKTNSEGGQADVSQVVSWEAKFVDSLSDVSKSLNISGALTITCAAIGGGGGAHANFVDTTKFINSDSKYNIQVQVTNQRLVADDVTEFTPIPNVPASKFNEVYGDCFISGFIEGGVLNATVLKKLIDEQDKKLIGGGIKIKADFKVASVEGQAEGKKEDETKKQTVDTTITINWSGGGDIKPDDVKEWDIPTLTKVAMEFPDKVAACPQKTFAILTKYTSLRSFHEQTVKGSPLDYEIAGIYTSSLLDAYMEYKAMWEDINQTIKEIDQGVSTVSKREPTDKLISYREQINADFDKRMASYEDAKRALAARSEYQDQITLEQPLPANKVDPYPADAFGMDSAARDCRFEMIKIVREVNDVTADPKVATDPYRTWRYLSPHVFRLLLPTDKKRVLTPEEIAKLQSDLEEKIKECVSREEEIQQAKKERDALKADNDSLSQQVASQKDESSASAERQTQGDTREKQLKEDLSSAQAAIKTKEDEQRALAEKVNALGKAVKESEKQMEQARQEKASLERRVGEVQGEAERNRQEKDRILNEWNSGPELEIHSITYGGKDIIGDGNVVNRVRDSINNNRSIRITNEFFGGDPAYGQRKRGVIAYNRRGKKVVRLEAWEGDTVNIA
ncbi:hypothetical protein B0T10DRAFT_519137 [Thelonectria olida]|uniref:Uncharacterized protein n=1 Tax=Thelonectria olida TaxID=1576542 RepID=A0A9P8VVN0_9HYPO|nr:hypothetical protein B0T10DRAFT_519137 [Thelonectria olida]